MNNGFTIFPDDAASKGAAPVQPPTKYGIPIPTLDDAQLARVIAAVRKLPGVSAVEHAVKETPIAEGKKRGPLPEHSLIVTVAFSAVLSIKRDVQKIVADTLEGEPQDVAPK